LSFLNANLYGIPQSETRCQKNVDKLCHKLRKKDKLDSWIYKKKEYQEILNFTENCNLRKGFLSLSQETILRLPLVSISLSPTFTTLPIYNFEPFVLKTKMDEPNEETLFPKHFEPSIPEKVLSTLLCTSQPCDPFFFARTSGKKFF
jgi:hypothetical protein